MSQLATPIMVHPIILTINFSLNRRGGAAESAKRIPEECRTGLLSFSHFKEGVFRLMSSNLRISTKLKFKITKS